MHSLPVQSVLLATSLCILPFSLFLVPYSAVATANDRRREAVLQQHTLARIVVKPKSEGDAVAKKQRLVFLHGWPDTMALFLPLADTLSQAGYEVVLLQLPGFPIPPELQNIVINPNPAPVRRWGFSFLETIVLLHQTLQSLKDDRHETVLVAHDWGALVAYLLLSKFTPDQAGISRLVTLDVGLRKEIHARMGLLILLYQG